MPSLSTRPGPAARSSIPMTPRVVRGRRPRSTLPIDLRAFAAVTGDHNPIHTSLAAARLAGLGEPIVHGMWISAAAQRVLAVETGRRITGWTSRFMSPVRPGAQVDVRADRVGLDSGDEVVDVTLPRGRRGRHGRVRPPGVAANRLRLPGPGHPAPGHGHGRLPAQQGRARHLGPCRPAHPRRRSASRSSPSSATTRPRSSRDGTSHRHPDGVLFLTQFTQVAMAVLGAAQMAELRESGAFVEGSVLAGHSVGEYNALAAVSGVIPLEAVVEVVFQRGSVMHTLVPRDAEGRSDYRLAAIRPSQIGLADEDVRAFVEGMAERTGEFLEIANYNLKGSQYAIAGTVAGLKALEAEIDERRAAFGGKGAFILVPGIDVPFHSRVLRGGVPDFRARLRGAAPGLDRSGHPDRPLRAQPGAAAVQPRPRLPGRDRRAGARRSRSTPCWPTSTAWSNRQGELCRLVLIELLAWQFASPVRWIETQDLMFAGACRWWARDRAPRRDRRGLGPDRGQPRHVDPEASVRPAHARRTRRRCSTPSATRPSCSRRTKSPSRTTSEVVRASSTTEPAAEPAEAAKAAPADLLRSQRRTTSRSVPPTAPSCSSPGGRSCVSTRSAPPTRSSRCATACPRDATSCSSTSAASSGSAPSTAPPRPTSRRCRRRSPASRAATSRSVRC